MEQSTRESMVPYDIAALLKTTGNIPTFLGARPIHNGEGLDGLDVVIAGLPWEGTNTWGSYSGCGQAPSAAEEAEDSAKAMAISCMGYDHPALIPRIVPRSEPRTTRAGPAIGLRFSQRTARELRLGR